MVYVLLLTLNDSSMLGDEYQYWACCVYWYVNLFVCVCECVRFYRELLEKHTVMHLPLGLVCSDLGIVFTECSTAIHGSTMYGSMLP